MTAPKVIWVGAAYGKQVGVDWSVKKAFEQDARYIRADAPELVALVDALREVADRPTLCTDGGELDWLIDDARRPRPMGGPAMTLAWTALGYMAWGYGLAVALAGGW